MCKRKLAGGNGPVCQDYGSTKLGFIQVTYAPNIDRRAITATLSRANAYDSHIVSKLIKREKCIENYIDDCFVSLINFLLKKNKFTRQLNFSLTSSGTSKSAEDRCDNKSQDRPSKSLKSCAALGNAINQLKLDDELRVRFVGLPKMKKKKKDVSNNQFQAVVACRKQVSAKDGLLLKSANEKPCVGLATALSCSNHKDISRKQVQVVMATQEHEESVRGPEDIPSPKSTDEKEYMSLPTLFHSFEDNDNAKNQVQLLLATQEPDSSEESLLALNGVLLPKGTEEEEYLSLSTAYQTTKENGCEKNEVQAIFATLEQDSSEESVHEREGMIAPRSTDETKRLGLSTTFQSSKDKVDLKNQVQAVLAIKEHRGDEEREPKSERLPENAEEEYMRLLGLPTAFHSSKGNARVINQVQVLLATQEHGRGAENMYTREVVDLRKGMDEEEEHMRLLGLPTAFRSSKDKVCSKNQVHVVLATEEGGLCNVEENALFNVSVDRSMLQLVFNSFWTKWGDILARRLWLEKFGHRMSTEDRMNLEESLCNGLTLCDSYPYYEIDVSYLYRNIIQDYSLETADLHNNAQLWIDHGKLVGQICARYFASAVAIKGSYCGKVVSIESLPSVVYNPVVSTNVCLSNKSSKNSFNKKVGQIRRLLNQQKFSLGSLGVSVVSAKLCLRMTSSKQRFPVKSYNCIVSSKGDTSYTHLSKPYPKYCPKVDDQLYRYCWMQNAKLQKYYRQRYHLFTKYKEGILMDEESWFSVTPEKIAVHIAKRCACDTIVDGFCGVGGNAIQFAKYCRRIIAVDVDPVKIKCAKRNAEIYGVEDRIEFLCGDFFDIVPQLKADVVFLSPPWGGPDYAQRLIFNVLQMNMLNGRNIYKVARRVAPNVAYFVPRNSAVYDIMELAENDESVEIEQNYLNGRLKTITVYYGSFNCANRDEQSLHQPATISDNQVGA